MKLHFLTSMFLALAAATALGEGQILLDNYANTSTSPTATSNGLFFFCSGGSTLINTDFNASFYGGSDANSLVLLGTFVNSGGGAAVGPGTFLDLSGVPKTIPGATSSAFFRIDAWLGSSTSYIGAFIAGAPHGSSGVFTNPVSTNPNSPIDFVNMPAVIIGPLECPQPSTFALAGLGAGAVLVFRRGK